MGRKEPMSQTLTYGLLGSDGFRWTVQGTTEENPPKNHLLDRASRNHIQLAQMPQNSARTPHTSPNVTPRNTNRTILSRFLNSPEIGSCFPRLRLL